jgi:hypothetical protein
MNETFIANNKIHKYKNGLEITIGYIKTPDLFASVKASNTYNICCLGLIGPMYALCLQNCNSQ